MNEDARFLVRLKGEIAGPRPLRDLLLMPGVNRESEVAPESEPGRWQRLEAALEGRPDLELACRFREEADALRASLAEAERRLKERERQIAGQAGRHAGGAFVWILWIVLVGVFGVLLYRTLFPEAPAGPVAPPKRISVPLIPDASRAPARVIEKPAQKAPAPRLPGFDQDTPPEAASQPTER